VKRNLSKQSGTKFVLFTLAVGICLLGTGNTAMADDYAYYTGPGVFGTVDLTTGTTVGSTFLTGYTPSMGIGVVNGTLYTLDYSYPSGQLHSIDPVTPSTSALNAFTSGMNGFPIGSANNFLYTIGHVSLSSTLQVQYYLTSISTSGLTNNIGQPVVTMPSPYTYSSGLANDSSTLYFVLADTLYAVNTSGVLIGSVSMASGLGIGSLVFENGTLYGADTSGKIYTLNTTTGASTLLSNTGFTIMGLTPAPAPAPSSAPEPCTMLLLGLGLIGMAGVRRFKQ
jgi:hypothetical protein